jgi:acetoin utilization deacetylase AcuC-like enzyme
MTTLFYSHPACQEHDPGPHHPESPARLRAVESALVRPEFAGLERREPPLGDLATVERVHPADFVDRILGAIPPHGHAAIDADTVVSEGSREAALRAIGALTGAVDAVAKGEAKNAFCAVRPPGHHAEPSRAMGFCLFNNVAVGALHARAAHGMDRVAVVDFDVHHGNGTQAMFEADKDLFFASTHQYPLYPGTGAASETGVGNIVNCPLPPNAGGPEFRAAMGARVLPELKRFAPEMIFISAGFDAHRDDPLAMLNFVEDDYAWATTQLMAVAEEYAGGRIVSTLEGGYNLQALANSAAAHVRALMGL